MSLCIGPQPHSLPAVAIWGCMLDLSNYIHICTLECWGGSVQDMDMDNRMALYQNIVLSGGTTMLPGLATRLERDIKGLYLQRILKVHTLQHAAFILPHMHAFCCQAWSTCELVM